MGVWGCRLKRRQRHSFETQLSASDERCQKESLYYYYVFNPRNFPKRYLSHGCHLLHLCSTLNLLLK